MAKAQTLRISSKHNPHDVTYLYVITRELQDGANSIELFELMRTSKKSIISQRLSITKSDSTDYLVRTLSDYDVHITESKEFDDLVSKRSHLLLSDVVSSSDLTEMLGINQKLLSQLVSKNSRIVRSEKEYCRWECEKTLKELQIQTYQNAALSLGLSVDCIGHVISQVKNLLVGVDLFNSDLQCTTNDIDSRIRRTLFGHRLFDSRSQFIPYFHNFLKEQHIDYTPEYCFISRSLNDDDKAFPSYIDYCLNRPVSVKYSVPIKNGKPGFLEPDRASVYTLIINEAQLSTAVWYQTPAILNAVESMKRLLHAK